MRILVVAVVAALLLSARPAIAHPTPFSYLDVRVTEGTVEVDLVAHIIDIAHDLNIERPEELLEPARLGARADDVVRLLSGRFRLYADGVLLAAGPWSAPVAVPDRQSIRMAGRFDLGGVPATIGLHALMFPYDPQHQTFVNVYESDGLSLQAILDGSKTSLELLTASRPGVRRTLWRFLRIGVQHTTLGPDHLIFLVGLVLLGGGTRRLILLVSAFTAAQALALLMAAFNVVNPPARLIEPALALGIVYVGADNLMVRDGQDVRIWIAAAVGFVHGLGFANVLRTMDLPRHAVAWALTSFTAGTALGQLLVALTIAGGLAWTRVRGGERTGRQVVYVGSLAVIAAGTFWFIQRVFFSGGMA